MLEGAEEEEKEGAEPGGGVCIGGRVPPGASGGIVEPGASGGRVEPGGKVAPEHHVVTTLYLSMGV